MQAVKRQKNDLTELQHKHRGDCRILVPDGVGAWRYHMLTSAQAKFWRSLSGAERIFLARLGRGSCFVCALRDLITRQERFEAGLHRALMSFLLVPTS